MAPIPYRSSTGTSPETSRVRAAMTAELAARPGVYLFRDGGGRLLYIGKARSLRKRVSSYFSADGNLPFRTRTMIRNARTLEFLVVRTEREALLLESSMIKGLRPKYNRRLMDARAYPYLVIDSRARSPRVMLSREVPADGAECFGPFPDVAALRSTLQVIRRFYTVRKESFERRADVPGAADQARMAGDLLAVLTGGSRTMVRRLEKAMRQAADAWEFGRAARLHQALRSLERLVPASSADTARASADPVTVVARGMIDLARQETAGAMPFTRHGDESSDHSLTTRH